MFGLLQVRAERAVDQADRGKVLHAGETHVFDLRRESGPCSRIGSVPHTPASTGVRRTTGSTSSAISITIALASP